MTFPATYNINYYMGDTHEFKVYPKDSSGAIFPLSQYSSVEFTIAERRGTPVDGDTPTLQGHAEFSADRTHVSCAITPEDSDELDPTKSYVFDVRISKTGVPYDSVFTLLTGNISIQNRVEPFEEDIIEAPTAPIAIEVTATTDSSITLSWDAPEAGGAPDSYKLYIIPYNVGYESTVALQAMVTALSLATPFSTTQTTYDFTNTTAVASLGIVSEPLEADTAYIYAIQSYNNAGTSTPAGNFNVTAGTIAEVFTDGGS
jgi:hypothetical protein